MVRIRLSRTGSKKQPSYRVVVANIESKRDGRVVERIDGDGYGSNVGVF